MHFLGYDFYRLCNPPRRNDDQEHFDYDRCDYQNYQIPVGLPETADKVIERHDDRHLPRLLKARRKSAENGDVIETGGRDGERYGIGSGGTLRLSCHNGG